MYERLNGSFFLKVLFSHITEGQKLKIAKYNKSLQETLERRLIHYKNFSQRYIINQSNGKGKEFNGFNDELLYEGDYKNGERNGKGKEYNSKGYVIFEGEYKNGKRNGKGKELISNKDLFIGLIMEFSSCFNLNFEPSSKSNLFLYSKGESLLTSNWLSFFIVIINRFFI